MSIDVLIVGAGPTGLMLANQLVRRGVNVTIIDRHAGPAEQTRAMAVHARTLEIYAKLGIAEQSVETGRRGDGANIWAGGRRKARIPLGEIGKELSPFPYVLMLGQDDNERILGERLRSSGGSVRWNTELIGLEHEPNQVTATIKESHGGATSIAAKYVAGCDGARSTVRQLCGIGFPGAPYEQVFFVADTEAIGPMVADELNVYLWRSGFHLYFPMRGPDRWRVIGILPAELRDRDDLTFADAIPSLTGEAGGSLLFKSCAWFSTYRIAHRCTERFRDRRCFLLGDAAHIHSPMGGQGMNTGLQDAYNLAWKLALVLQSRADDSLLDSYEAERRPVAQRLLATTDRAFRFVVSSGRTGELFRTRILANVAAIAMTRKRVQRAAFRMLSQIGIRYRRSMLSQTLDGVRGDMPRAGDRFPWLRVRFQSQTAPADLFAKLDDTPFNLLVIGQPAPSSASLKLGDLVRIHTIPLDGDNRKTLAAVGIKDAAFFLLRPDGHIGLAGTEFQANAIARWFARCRIRAGSDPRSTGSQAPPPGAGQPGTPRDSGTIAREVREAHRTR